MDVQQWLVSKGFEQYVAAFAAERIDGAALRSLSADDLELLGVSALGDRKKLLAAIAALAPETASDDEAALRTFVDCWPSVLALPLKDYLDEADPRIKLWAACDLVELILRFLVMIGVARAARDGVVPDGVAKVLAKHIEHPTLWDWRNMADALARGAQRTDSFTAKADLFLLDVLAPLLAGSIKPPSAENSLARLRNRLAHGAGITKKQAKHLLEAWKSPFEAAIAQASWLGEMTLLVRDLGKEWGELRGLTLQPISIAAPATEVDRVVTSGMYVAYGERLLALWPLGLYGPPKKAGAEAPESIPAPQVYARRGEMHLEYTPLGEGEECESIGDAEALMGFLRLFRIDRTRAEIVGEGHAVRGFEQEMRKDSDRLLGRREVIGTLERVVRETAHGLIWVSGKAGVGKSFVMSRVAIDLLEEGPEGWLILPYRFRIVDSRCSRESFLRFARERLDSWLDRPFEEGVAERVSGERSQPIDRLKDSLEAQPADRRVLFILDGLDEITERDPEFAREIPLALRQHNVLWVCCGRPQDGLQEAFRGAKAIEPFTDGLPRMSMDDIREILVEKLGPLRRRLLRGDRDEGDKVVNRFVERVAKNAEGLPIYVKYVVGDVLNGLLAPEAPGQLPSSLSQYHAELLRRLQVGDLHQILTPLAVTLAVAREPLTVEKLTALLSRRSFVKPDEAGVALVAKAMSAIESMVRLAPDPDGGEGYTLWHESLREHMFTSPDVSIAIATARQAMADAGLRPSGDAAEPYLYRQGVGHLLEERRRDEALDLLSESEYVYSRLATLKGLRPFSGLALDWVAWLMPSQDRETLEKSARMFRARLDVLCATVPRVAERTWLELLGHIVVWELAPRLRMHLGGQLALAHVLPYANRILEHLLGLEPNNRKVLRDLGVTYDLLGGLVKRTDAMQARDWFEKSNTIAERLAELEPDNLVFLRDLGISNDRLGELVADTDVTQARRWHEKSLAVRERLVALEPDNLDYRRDLTLSYDNIGELVGRTDATQARDSYEKALAIRKRLVAFAPDNLDYLHCLSKSYTRLGELVSGTEIGEARGWYEYGLAIRERITELEPNNIVYLQDLSVSYERLGNLLAAADSAKARDLYRKGCSIQERLLTLEPDNSSYLRSLSGFLQGLGDLERGTDIFKARGLYEKSLAIRERLAALQPDNRVYLHHLSVSCERLAALMADDDSRQACHWYLKAAEIAERLETLDPESLLTYMHFRGALYSRLGDLMAAADTAQARNWYQKAAEIAERTADLDPESVTHAIYRDWLYVKLGELLRGTDAAAARVWYEKGLAITERLATLEPDNVTYLRGLSVSYERLGDLAVRTEAAAAYGWYEKALTIRERLATHGACDPADLDKMSWAYHRMGDAEERAGNAAVAREWRMKQLHVRQTLAALQPRSISIRRDMSIALFNLGCLDAKLGDSTAGSWFDQAIALRRELVGELPNDPDLWERLARACYERMALALQQRQPSEAQPFEQECTAALDRASALAPQRSSVRYLRACVLAVTGEPAAALDALAQASELGWDDADEALKERDFESLRELPRFNELIEGMRRNKAAGQQT